MTIKQMKNIAKETMNTELSYLSGDVSKACEVRATLFAFFLVDLFSDDEYRVYCDLICHAELNCKA